jgi:hypothetical protein
MPLKTSDVKSHEDRTERIELSRKERLLVGISSAHAALPRLLAVQALNQGVLALSQNQAS